MTIYYGHLDNDWDWDIDKWLKPWVSFDISLFVYVLTSRAAQLMLLIKGVDILKSQTFWVILYYFYLISRFDNVASTSLVLTESCCLKAKWKCFNKKSLRFSNIVIVLIKPIICIEDFSIPNTHTCMSIEQDLRIPRIIVITDAPVHKWAMSPQSHQNKKSTTSRIGPHMPFQWSFT